MQPQKTQKIDLSADYPCPTCHRRGRLVSITLTDAFGCSRCKQIFVVEESGYTIEQLSTTYPYKKSWRWTGHQWHIAHSRFRDIYFPIALIIIIVLFVGLPLALGLQTNPKNVGTLAVLLFVIIMLLALLQWLAYRR